MNGFHTRRGIALPLVAFALAPYPGLSQDQIAAVSEGPGGVVQIMFAGGRKTTVPKERGQTGISDALIAPDGTVSYTQPGQTNVQPDRPNSHHLASGQNHEEV